MTSGATDTTPEFEGQLRADLARAAREADEAVDALATASEKWQHQAQKLVQVEAVLRDWASYPAEDRGGLQSVVSLELLAELFGVPLNGQRLVVLEECPP